MRTTPHVGMRAAVAVLLFVAACLCATAGTAALCLRDTVVDADEFGRRAVAALGKPQVREVLARRITTEVVHHAPETAVVRPLLEVAVHGALVSDAFQRIIAAAVADLHRTVLAGDQDTVTLRLVDLVLVVKSQLAATHPELADRIPVDVTDALVRVNADIAPSSVARLIDLTRAGAVGGPLSALVLLSGSVLVLGRRSAGLALAGGALVLTGLAVRLLPPIGSRVVVRTAGASPDEVVLSDALWRSLTAELPQWSAALMVIGVAVATAALLGGRGLRLELAVERAVAAVRPPASGRGRARWLACAALVGAALLLRVEEALLLAVRASGAVVLLLVVAEVARSARHSPRLVAQQAKLKGAGPRRWLPGAVAATAAVILVAGAAAVVVVTDPPALDPKSAPGPAAAADPRCNGSVLLCDRPLDQVAFAATHNSTADVTAGFANGNQDGSLADQLDAGFRGLLLDVYFGLSSPRVPFIITDRAASSAQERAELVTEVGEAAVRSAEQLRARALGVGGSRETYTCHAYCELGAAPLVPVLRTLRDWLETHPREIVLVFVQDEIPARDVVHAFKAAGLDRYAHTQQVGDLWPTLGELIDDDQRLVVLAESSGGAASWYHDGFALTEETPYAIASPAEFTCAPNRGGSGRTLFLVNHFITPPSRPAATRVNLREVLEPRLRRCQRERNHIPNLVAVDFYTTGDTIAVVDALNGVSVRRR